MGDKIPDFRCPADCLAGIGEVWSGQYDFPAVVNGRCRVLDIGANVGAFALWARRKWPLSTVVCFEPHPEIFRQYLRPNTAHDPEIICHQVAVGDPSMGLLRTGIDTRLCCSQYDIGRQGNGTFKVGVLEPQQLPMANIVKVDTEGAEGYIIEHLAYVPNLLVVEYHSEPLRVRVVRALAEKMQLIRCSVDGKGWGHMHFARLAA